MNTIVTSFKLKVTILFICCGLFINVNASNSKIRNLKISLNLENATLLEAFDEIQELTSLNFFYKNSDIDLSSTVSINVEKQLIGDVLDELLKNKPITFKIHRNKIILKKKKSILNDKVNYQITGKIIDKNTKKPIQNCNILVQKKQKGSSSNEIGEFHITESSPFPKKLTISHVNYKKQVVTIKEDTNIIIELVPLENKLQTVLIKSNKAHYKIKNISSIDKYGRAINRKKVSRNIGRRSEFSRAEQNARQVKNTKDAGTSIMDWIFCKNQ